MDQHAAHEKILYEKILETLNKEHINVQQFIRPIDLKLDEEETNILNDNLEFFKRFGFDIGVKKNGDYVLKGIPYLFDVVDNSGFFTSILDKFKDITMVNGIYDTKLSKIADIACKKAIKKNDKLDDMSVKQLIKDLGQLKEPFNCPHGRPILIEISRLDLDKKFKRIV
jgi:DNA mismatch repair protein MutL